MFLTVLLLLVLLALICRASGYHARAARGARARRAYVAPLVLVQVLLLFLLVLLLSGFFIMRPGARFAVTRAATRAGNRRAPLRSPPAQGRQSARGSSGARYAVTLRKMPNRPQPSPREPGGRTHMARTASAAAGRHRPRACAVRFCGRTCATAGPRALLCHK